MSDPTPRDHATHNAGCCSGFTRAQALKAALSGGRPVAREWDPRMPIPAGTGIDRRTFIRGAAGGVLAVYGADRIGLTNRVLGDGIAEAAAAQSATSPILVTIFLQGGIDALSLLAPVNDPTYQKLRTTLAVTPGSGPTLPEDTSLEWNPAARSFADLHQAGKLTVFPGIGYADPDMSHFTSRHYWEVGGLDTRLMTGWLGRFIDVVGSNTNPLQALSMDGAMNPTLATMLKPTAAIDRPDNFSMWMQGMWGDPLEFALQSAGALGDRLRGSHDAAIAQVAAAASEVETVRLALKPYVNADGGPAYTSPVTYPTSGESDLPQRLAGLAAMIAGGLPLKCVSMTTDTAFDTHSAQPGTFGPGLQLAADSIKAFQADLEARGIADRVLVQVWSEFGRRAQQNSSNGTDHGAAGNAFLIGTRTSGGMIGEFPQLTNLDVNGNQIANVDFRGVYCSLLEQWFGQDAGAVIPGAKALPRYQLLNSGSPTARPTTTTTSGLLGPLATS